MTNPDIHILRYDSKYKESILSLLGYLWRDLDETQQRELFTWRYLQNPFTTNPVIYLAIHQDRVIGFRGFVVHHFVKGQSEPFPVFSPADTIIHPDYRGKGLFYRLNQSFFEDVQFPGMNKGIILNLSSNEQSTPLNLKQGWQATDGLKRFGLRFSFRNTLLIRSGLGNAEWPKTSSIQGRGFQIGIGNTPRTAELAAFYLRNRPQNRLTLLRNASFYRWRYDDESGCYRFVYHYRHGELTGYLIIKKLSNTQYLLWEYAAINPQVLRRMINKAIQKLRIPFLRTWVLSANDSKWLWKCGFVAPPTRLWQLLGKIRLPVLVRPVKERYQEEDFILEGLDIRSIENWQLFLSDRH
ncbi:MAG: hypothetical protein ACQESL_08590 [Bacteroidota bacterium]